MKIYPDKRIAFSTNKKHIGASDMQGVLLIRIFSKMPQNMKYCFSC